MAQMFTLKQASAECGVSFDTIKRRLTGGSFPSAAKDSSGKWVIPLEDLLAAGLHPGKPSAGADDGAEQPAETEPDVIGLREELATRRAEVTAAERLRTVEVEAERVRLEAVQGQIKQVEASKAELQEMTRTLLASERADKQAARRSASNWQIAALIGWLTAAALLGLTLAAIVLLNQ